MSEHSAISWTDASWNCLAGCTRVTEECDFCYAAELAATRLKNTPSYRDLAVITPSGRPAFNGRVRYIPHKLAEPLRWKAGRKIFVNSMSDLFHDAVPEAVIDRVFAVMALAPRHTFQILTKRPERMQQYCEALTIERLVEAGSRDSEGRPPIGGGGQSLYHIAQTWQMPTELPLKNVWLGTSVGIKAAAHRVDVLRHTKAAVRFLSCEPMLEDLPLILAGIDWVIIGGETGKQHRPMQIEWVEALVALCRRWGVAVFLKQDSGRIPGRQGRLPDDLWQLKQFPGHPEAAHA